MKERVSVLMDGELDDKSAAAAIQSLANEREARDAWRSYHLIGDLMRGSAPLSEGFAARITWKLAEQPTVLAPGRIRPQPRRWFTVSAAAASLAAVALVAWLAFAPQPQVPAAPLAQAKPEAPAIVPMPTAANDYLLAHQGFSPRVSLQGMAPYVRTVSEQTVEPRR
ncbi:MAG TPA: sigma-E factor negative regulatory protein [Burkholderiales bacterium]|nr:sigma-E factor negative regulatory protein [Burkholderiales bacterium]